MSKTQPRRSDVEETPLSSTPELLSVTNQSPLPAERAAVEESMASLQNRIDALDQTVKILRQERDLLAQRREEQSATIVPVRRLPPELLLLIFKCCVDGWWDVNNVLELSDLEPAKQAPVYSGCGGPKWEVMPMHILTCVCQRWRVVGRAQATLWTNVYMKKQLRPLQVLQLLEVQLGFSRTQPLQVLLSPEYFGRAGAPLLQSLQNCHLRWRSMQMALVDHPHPLFPVFKPSLVFSLLQSLTITLYPFKEVSPVPILKLSATDVPALTEFSLACVKNKGERRSPLPRFLDLPWAQLRKVDFLDLLAPLASNYISQMQQVEELSFSGQDKRIIPYSDAHLFHLRRLEITTLYASATERGLMHHMRLPALKSLTWTKMGLEDGFHVVSMLKRSTPMLEKLILVDPLASLCGPLSDASARSQLEEILASTGLGLKSLHIAYTIKGNNSWPEIFTLLVRSIEASTLPPQLSTLRLHGVDLDIPAFYRILKLSLKKRHDFKLHVTGREDHRIAKGVDCEELLFVLNQLRAQGRIISVIVVLSGGNRLRCSAKEKAKIVNSHELFEDSDVEEALGMIL